MIGLQLHGVYPLVSLKDSVVHQEEGFSFQLSGLIDLRHLDKLPTQIRELKKKALVAQDKNKREWVFKRLQTGANRDSVTELKYLWLKDDRGDTQGILGFEKTIGF